MPNAPGVMKLVPTVKVYDRAEEFRIEIIGRFSGECVAEIAETWEKALGETGSRRFTIDISRLSSFDSAGRKLLYDMYRHGMQFAAGTPLSLVLLNEISAPPARATGRPRQAETTTHVPRAVAAGE